MPRRRLLVVTDEMEVGGSQRQITYLLGGVDPSRWRRSLAYFRNPSFLVETLREQHVDIHHIPKRARLDPRFMLAYAAHLRRENYDVVHAFSLTAELYTALASLFMRQPPCLVSSIRGMYLLLPRWFWWLKRWILSRSDAVIANAQAGIDAAMSRTGFQRARFDLIGNGVPDPAPLAAERREAIRETLAVPAGRTFCLFVGRLVHQKNPSCLLRALHRIPAGQRPWVALAGEGPLRGESQDLVREFGLQDDVVLLGERDDTMALIQSADYLVLPSLHEGMPNVLLEAMSAGTPVVAANVGGCPELIEHGVTGLLFDIDDDAALAAAMQRLGNDPELRHAFSASALAVVHERYSVAAMVRATERVYERCLAGREAVARDGTTPLEHGTPGSTT